MKRYNKLIGTYGEELTANYLKARNYSIEKTNFTCFLGEIDIIAKKGNIVCFVEVRSKYGVSNWLPRESMTNKKIETIRKVAEFYIVQKKINSFTFRFDFSEIIFEDIHHYKLNYLKNAF